jgi:hypothetical protein
MRRTVLSLRCLLIAPAERLLCTCSGPLYLVRSQSSYRDPTPAQGRSVHRNASTPQRPPPVRWPPGCAAPDAGCRSPRVVVLALIRMPCQPQRARIPPLIHLCRKLLRTITEARQGAGEDRHGTGNGWAASSPTRASHPSVSPRRCAAMRPKARAWSSLPSVTSHLRLICGPPVGAGRICAPYFEGFPPSRLE